MEKEVKIALKIIRFVSKKCGVKKSEAISVLKILNNSSPEFEKLKEASINGSKAGKELREALFKIDEKGFTGKWELGNKIE